MGPLEVIVTEVAAKTRSQFKAVGIVPEVNVFVFHSSPQPLDEDIVMGSTPTVHADPHSGFFESGDEGIGRELSPLVGIEYLRQAGFHCLMQAVQTELAVQGVGYFPGDDVTGEPVHDCHEVHESLPHPDVCDVGAPDLVGTANLDLPKQIGVDLMLMAGHRGLGFGIDGLKSHFLHQPPHSLVIDWKAQAPEIYSHSGPTVKRGFRILLIDQLHQEEV